MGSSSWPAFFLLHYIFGPLTAAARHRPLVRSPSGRRGRRGASAGAVANESPAPKTAAPAPEECIPPPPIVCEELCSTDSGAPLFLFLSLTLSSRSHGLASPTNPHPLPQNSLRRRFPHSSEVPSAVPGYSPKEDNIKARASLLR